VFWDGIRKAKAHLELNLVRAVKEIRDVYSSERKTREK